MSLEAVVLAAGMGSRFGTVTQHQPKALIELNGQPLLFRMIRQCRAAGAMTINIVVGHCAAEVIERVTDEFGVVGFDFIRNDQYATTNNILSLSLALNHLRGRSELPDLLVLECDVILTEDVLPQVVAYEAADVAVVSPYEAGLDGTVVRLSSDQVTEFIPTSKQSAEFDFSGTFKTVNVYKFAPGFWSQKLLGLLKWYLDAVGKGSYYENVIGLASYAGSNELKAFVISSDAWHEVDDSNDLRKASYKFRNGPKYSQLIASHGGWWDVRVTDFFYLRNMYFPPPAMLAQLRGSFVSALQNYGSTQKVLDEKISWFLGTQPQETLFLSGLSSLYPSMAEDLDTQWTLVPYPSFGEYDDRFPRAYRYDPHLDLGALRDLIGATRATCVFVVNPNNPSGTLHATTDLIAMANDFSAVQFIFDESFLPFTGQQSAANLSEEFGSNIVVISSLGKTLGVPGLRVGYAWSKDVKWIDRFRGELPIWANNSVAEQLVSLLPKYKVEYQNSLIKTEADRADFTDLLAGINDLQLVDGAAGNFINVMLLKFPAELTLDVCERFLTEGFLVKSVHEKLGIGNVVLRVAVRLPAENRAFAALLTDIAAG